MGTLNFHYHRLDKRMKWTHFLAFKNIFANSLVFESLRLYLLISEISNCYTSWSLHRCQPFSPNTNVEVTRVIFLFVLLLSADVALLTRHITHMTSLACIHMAWHMGKPIILSHFLFKARYVGQTQCFYFKLTFISVGSKLHHGHLMHYI